MGEVSIETRKCRVCSTKKLITQFEPKYRRTRIGVKMWRRWTCGVCDRKRKAINHVERKLNLSVTVCAATG